MVAILKARMARNGWMCHTCRWVHIEAMYRRLLTQLVDHRHLEQVLHHELIGLVHLKFLHIQLALLHVEMPSRYFTLRFLVFLLGHILMRSLTKLVQNIGSQIPFLT